jgi:beta-glucosidase
MDSGVKDAAMLWASDPKEINRLQHVAVEQTRMHIPVLFGLDVIHGYRTIFPAPIAMASSWDTKMVEEAQAVAAGASRAAGIQWTFAPMVDIARDRVLACVNHFAGYGAAEGGRDYDSSYIPPV